MTTSPRRRPFLAGVLAACLLAAGLSACSSEPTEPTSGNDTSSRSPKPKKTTSEPSETPADPTSEPAGTTTVPAYFVADTPQGPRLFREFRKVEGDPLTAAAALVTTGDALDPDYRTLWPAIELASVQATDGVLLVEIAGDGFTERPDGMSERDAELALQQLVYTLQGAQQERSPVVVERGDTDSRLFGLSTETEFRQGPPLETLGLASVTSPEEGATVSGSFTASGVASSFEATVPWEIRDGDRVMKSGFATAEGWMDKLHPWETSVDVSGLQPGTYEFVAMTSDPSGGAEGAGPTEDSKTITVE